MTFLKKLLPVLVLITIGIVLFYLNKRWSNIDQKIKDIEVKYEQKRAALQQKYDSVSLVVVNIRAERDSANAKLDRGIDSVNLLRKKDAIAYQRKIARLENRTVKQLEYEADSLFNALNPSH